MSQADLFIWAGLVNAKMTFILALHELNKSRPGWPGPVGGGGTP